LTPSSLRHSRRRRFLGSTIAALAASGGECPALADESGVSFWQLGSYASQAAVPAAPGLSIDTTYYSAAVNSDSTTNFTRGGRVQTGLSTRSNYLAITPSYAFDTPVLGGQLEFGVTVLAGNYSSTMSGMGAGAGPSGSASDSMTAFGDLFPLAALKWAQGDHNFMIYTAANVPFGNYDVNRQASVGLGYWTVDGGGGYTYFDQGAGHEFSAVVGFTYNFMNPYTAYQSGIDMHLELSASQYLTDRLSVGLAGYFYNQVTADSGSGATVGPFISRVAGVGPQLGYNFNLGERSASLSARGYYEFSSQNRAQGWNAWLTFVIELGPLGQKVARAP
jgi:hypothetical protein